MLAVRTLNPVFDRMLSLNRVFDDAFNGAWNSSEARWVPTLDIVEKKDAYMITLDIPGVDPSKVDVTFEQNVLTVRGTKESHIEKSDERVFASERFVGSFERSVRLPEFVDGENISAESKNGVLTLTVPKAAAAQTRKIVVKA